MPTRNLIALIVLAVTALVLFQLVTRVAEYELCLNERRHFPTNFTKYEADIKTTCLHQTILWPF